MIWVTLCFLCCYFGGISCVRDVSFVDPAWSFNSKPARNFSEECLADSSYWKGRVPWIILQRVDYGWKQHTHRGNIALAVNNYKGIVEEVNKTSDPKRMAELKYMGLLLDPTDEVKKTGLQLEVEMTKAIFRNASSRIHENDLALFIHASLATKLNPRNFYGHDLVADLMHRVQDVDEVHPFLTLALCNSHVITFELLRKIKHYTDNVTHDGRALELKALALKTFACAKTLGKPDPGLYKFDRAMKQASDCLRENQRADGSFGNVYTTSLAVQALIASGSNNWNEAKAFEYLTREAYINVNMIKAYYIEMALNARNVKFIKDLYPGEPQPPLPRLTDNRHYIQYTIMKGLKPDNYFTVTIKVSKGETFFSVMKRVQALSDSFKLASVFGSYQFGKTRFWFKYFVNKEQLPVIYSVAGTPNDAEENMFWRVCRQNAVKNDRHVSRIEDYHDSPENLLPLQDEHISLRYISTVCL